MKKIFAIILTGAMILSLASCGTSETGTGSANVSAVKNVDAIDKTNKNKDSSISTLSLTTAEDIGGYVRLEWGEIAIEYGRLEILSFKSDDDVGEVEQRLYRDDDGNMQTGYMLRRTSLDTKYYAIRLCRQNDDETYNVGYIDGITEPSATNGCWYKDTTSFWNFTFDKDGKYLSHIEYDEKLNIISKNEGASAKTSIDGVEVQENDNLNEHYDFIIEIPNEYVGECDKITYGLSFNTEDTFIIGQKFTYSDGAVEPVSYNVSLSKLG